MKVVLLASVLSELVKHIEEYADGEEALVEFGLLAFLLSLQGHHLVVLVEHNVQPLGGIESKECVPYLNSDLLGFFIVENVLSDIQAVVVCANANLESIGELDGGPDHFIVGLLGLVVLLLLNHLSVVVNSEDVIGLRGESRR